MSSVICGRCGLVEPPGPHHGSLLCRERRFISAMEARGWERIPARRWRRALKRAGAPVVHGPVSVSRTGAWTPREYLATLVECRAGEEFRRLPFHLQVATVVWRVKRPLSSSAPPR